jgi:MoaA/NifB/PqqE/SkfB family radical SAM enzyme
MIRETGEPGKVLASLKREGVHNLNITGGEPLLSNNLLEILKTAKNFGLQVELTTNGILYPDKARTLTGLIDRLFFSLDHPIAEEHDRSRGIDCFHTVIQAIKLAKELGDRPIIKFTMTRDSVRFLPEMVELSEKLGAPVYLNPVYDFFGTQGFEAATYDHIRYYAKKKNVIVSHAVIEFAKNGGNRVIMPRCRAQETTITILPDGSRVFPCFYNQGGRQGKEDVCSSCMRWPYMLPSFAVGIDRYFWLDWYAKRFEFRSRQGGK